MAKQLRQRLGGQPSSEGLKSIYLGSRLPWLLLCSKSYAVGMESQQRSGGVVLTALSGRCGELFGHFDFDDLVIAV